MLFKRRFLDGIADGSVSVAYRRWRRPTVKSGGTLRTRIGVVAIDAVDVVAEAEVTEADARCAGFPSRDALFADLRPAGEGQLYRIELRLAGPDPRIELRDRAELTADELADVERRLARFDASSRDGPWTATVVRTIAASPGERAADLAASIGADRDRLKARVRKLKELGLTESLGTGYRLSPRGRAVLDRLG